MKIALQCHARLHVEVPAAEDFQLLCLKASIGVYSARIQSSGQEVQIVRNFQSILLVNFDFADSAACAIPVDGDRIIGRNRISRGGMQFSGNRFVVPSGCLNDLRARVFTQCEDLIRQTLQTDCIVHDVDRYLDYLAHRTSATVLLPLGNIDADYVHFALPHYLGNSQRPFLLIACSISCGMALQTHRNGGSTCLNRNAANERGGFT